MRWILKMVLFVPAFLLMFYSTAMGATYYVDDANGSDSNPGTEESPWLTIPYTRSAARSGNTVAEGDTVYFKNGDYGTFLEHTNYAQSALVYRDDWITYIAATGHEPNLTSISIQNLDKWGGDGNGRSYLIFDGFNITDGANIKYTSYFQITDCNITRSTPEVEGYHAPYVGGTAIAAIYTDHLTIEDCNISYAYRGIGVTDSSSDIVIRNNTIHYIGEDGMVLSVTGLTVEDNLVYDISKYRTIMEIQGVFTGTFDEGDLIIFEGTDCTGVVRNSTLSFVYAYDTNETNWRTAWQGGATVITNLTSDANVTSITKVDYAHTDCITLSGTGSTITGNRLIRAYLGGDDGQVFKSVNSHSAVIENNLFYGLVPLYWEETYNAILNNNTIVGGNTRLQATTLSTIDELYNNCIEGWVKDGGGVWNVVSHGNNIFGNSPSWGGSYPFDMNETEISVGENFADLFQNSDINDFNLVDDSVAIDFGNDTYAPELDILDNNRVGTADAGAYEYQSDPNVANHAPVLGAIGAQSVYENDEMTITLTATDEDSDELTYYCTTPSGATFSSPTFTWTPGYRQSGTHQITTRVTDGEVWDTELVTITVTNSPQGVIF